MIRAGASLFLPYCSKSSGKKYVTGYFDVPRRYGASVKYTHV